MDGSPLTSTQAGLAEEKNTGPAARRKARARALTESMSGQPGRPPRSPEPSTAALAARQERCFELHLAGYPNTQIAQVVGIDRQTVALDIQMEGMRRANEFAGQRQANVAASLGRLHGVIQRALSRGQHLRNAGIKETTTPEGKTEATVVSVKALAAANLADRLVVMAQKEINAILGLNHVPDVPVPTQTNNTLVVLLEHLPADKRLDVLRSLTAEAKTVGALPAGGKV